MLFYYFRKKNMCMKVIFYVQNIYLVNLCLFWWYLPYMGKPFSKYSIHTFPWHVVVILTGRICPSELHGSKKPETSQDGKFNRIKKGVNNVYVNCMDKVMVCFNIMHLCNELLFYLGLLPVWLGRKLYALNNTILPSYVFLLNEIV